MTTAITLTKLVIETQSPMAINTGNRELGFDTQLTRDVNGLPVIPASAIAGVWRHLCEQTFVDTALANKWFGSTEQAARFSISRGQLLDSNSQVVSNYISKDQLQADPLLRLCALARPHYRDRVRLNDRGVAMDGGKFDQLLLPKGVRFAIDLQWTTQPRQDGQVQTEAEWQQLLSLWQSPHFAFGSSTRNGLGRINIIASEQQCFDLSQGPQIGQALQAFRRKPCGSVHQLQAQLADSAPQPFACIKLQALDNWRCGSGVERLGRQDTGEHKVAMISYSEPAVVWQGTKAQIAPNQAVLCGSSIKGMLAHRIAFHYRRRIGQWAETLAEAEHATWQQRPIELKALLGHADEQDHSASLAGALWVADAPLSYQHTVVRTHNSIDRFTGGVRGGALFSEELLYQPQFELQLHLSRDLSAQPELLGALQDTLDDLKAGRLPLGAGSGRGTSLVIALDADLNTTQQEASAE